MQNLSKEEFHKTIVALIVVFTGITAFIYQTVWVKYLTLSLGSSTIARIIVITTLLSGFAIGNYLFGKKSDVIKNPLKVFAVLEIAVTLYASAFPILHDTFGGLFFNAASESLISGKTVVYNFLRFTLSASLLMLPAVAIGGTLPLLTSFFANKISKVRKDVATLYFLYLFGAALGVFFAGFILIEKFGLQPAIYIAAMINLIVGFTAFTISTQVNEKEGSEVVLLSGNKNENLSITKSELRVITIVTVLMGISLLIYETSFVRFFQNVFGASTYLFPIIVTSFIGGILIGSFIASRYFFEKHNRLFLISFLQFAIAVVMACVLLFAERIPYYTWNVASWFNKTESTFGIFLFSEFTIAFIVTFLPALLMGISLPLFTEIFTYNNSKAGYSAGKVFTLNLIGFVVGVLLNGFLFIPVFGMQGGFNIAVFVSVLSGALLLLSTDKISQTNKGGLAGFTIVIVAIYFFSSQEIAENIVLSNVFNKFDEEPPATYYEYKKNVASENLLFFKEETYGSVAVIEKDDFNKQKILCINGSTIVYNNDDKQSRILLAQIPLMLHPNPEKIFIAGFGGGTAINSVLTHNVNKVVCAEPSNAAVNAASIINNENSKSLKDKRLNIIAEDPYATLNLSVGKYDVIISQPPNLWNNKFGNLFTKEYFEVCKSKLDTNGIMVQLFRLSNTDDNVVRLVLNTFKDVFKFAQIWNGNENDIILVGSENRIKLNNELLKEKFAQSEIRNEFNKIGINNPFTFLSCQSNSTEGFYILTALKKPINTELLPLLGSEASKAFYLRANSELVEENDERFDTLSVNILAKQYLKRNKIGFNNLLNTAEYHFNKTKNYHFAYGITDYLRKHFPENLETEKLYAKCLTKLEFDDNNRNVLKNIISKFKKVKKETNSYLNILLTEKLYATTFIHIANIDSVVNAFISEAEGDSAKLAETYLQLAKVYLQNSEIKKSENMLKGLFEVVNKKPETKNMLKMDDYYYVSLMLAFYRDDQKSMLNTFMSLLNTNSQYPGVNRFKGFINARMELGK